MVIREEDEEEDFEHENHEQYAEFKSLNDRNMLLTEN